MLVSEWGFLDTSTSGARERKEGGDTVLALSNPEIARELLSFPGGLIPIRPDGKLSLAIKTSKEALLAVQQQRSFSVYVVPIPAKNGEAISIVTAFFDDADEPLVVRTPLFGDESPSVETVALLMAEEIDVYFFDELGWERMSHRCTVEDPGSYFVTNDDVRLAPFSAANSTAILEILGEWFGLRTPEEDARAIKVRLQEQLWPSDQVILDVRDGPNDYVGSDGFVMSALERDATRPGFHQERDIAALLRRFLSSEQIILNPFKRGSAKEFADVVCGTSEHVLIIQAKDSPNTAQALARSIDRKRRTSESQLKDALSQVIGARRYIGNCEPVLLTCKGQDIDLYIADRELIGVALIKEIFPTQSSAIIAALQDHHALGQRLAILDFPGLSAFVHHFPHEDRFARELNAYTDAMLAAVSWIPAKTYLNNRLLHSG